MARRIGGETVIHFASAPQQFGSKGGFYEKARFSGCWVGPADSSEGTAGHDSVTTSGTEIWIPDEVGIEGSSDYFVWTRYPDEKYEATGKSQRLMTRRGQLRATTIPVREVS